MKKKQQSPIWPYLGILACLFVLSLTAPRAWDRMSRPETIAHLAALRQTQVATGPRRPSDSDYEQSESVELPSQPEVSRPVDLRLDPEPEVPITFYNPPAAPAPPPAVSEYAAEVRTAEPAEVAHETELATPDPVEPAPAAQPADIDEAEPEAVAQSEPAVEQDPSGWPLPKVLLRQLAEVVRDEPHANWALEAGELIHELCRDPERASRSRLAILAELRKLADADPPSDRPTVAREAQLIRAHYSLRRWVDIWEPAAKLDEQQPVVEAGSMVRIAAVLAEVEALATRAPAGAAWRKYLQLDALSRAVRSDDDASVDERRALARRVLDRLASPDLTRSQRKFIADGPLGKLAVELRPWAAENITAQRLLEHLDRYEQTELPSDAWEVANDERGLAWSSPATAAALGQHLDTHYRNANVRAAVTSDMVNLLVPQPEAVESAVRDTVLDAQVSGRSTTFTKLSVVLVPDPRRIRLGLEASGLVSSDTVASSGPARLYGQGQSTFLVRKLFVLGPDGLAVWPAQSEAENTFNYLRSVETDFDGVPLFGPLVRNIARSQHDEKRDEARWEVERKVAIRAKDQLDAEIRPRLAKVADELEKKQSAALRRLGLELVPVSLSTTEERAVARARLAGTQQLGAHTPRPRAPSDSWFSLQVHQSALNNGLEGLALDGRTFTLDQLFAWLAKKLDQPELARQEDLPEDVRLTFAPKDAVRLVFEDDHVDVHLSFAELRQGSTRWRNFTVKTSYRPEPDGLAPLFVRDTGISLSKGVKNRTVLYGIFSKVLSKNRDLRLLGESLTSDPRVQNLEITQFVVEHGWIALAYSAERKANDVARRPRPVGN